MNCFCNADTYVAVQTKCVCYFGTMKIGKTGLVSRHVGLIQMCPSMLNSAPQLHAAHYHSSHANKFRIKTEDLKTNTYTYIMY